MSWGCALCVCWGENLFSMNFALGAPVTASTVSTVLRKGS